ncbi:MAG: NAD(P)-dependent glycerol-3-phosphate dehydrogenase, partial [Saprospiraceae bacterium]|nr:NAD(P)-dependent glycerol-3-phosphate dehydrogenase [Saprospiraceae bacterium]
IGAGSFGTAIANLIALNHPVLLYSRNQDLSTKIAENRVHQGVELNGNVEIIHDLEKLANSCSLLFPIIPSTSFRSMMKDLGPFLKPSHILIHGTKGFDSIEDLENADDLRPDQVFTMSKVIMQESSVVRIGCLSGPNLAKEILEGQPTATLIASHFREVIKKGQRVLKSNQFHVFGSPELLGAELAGALKNSIAIGSGMLAGRGFGKNIQAMLITRGLTEMVHLGQAMGTGSRAFIGTAGIGDLVATATSKKSRNFTFGYHLAQGKTKDEIHRTMPELAEGVRTIKITKLLSRHFGLRTPITDMLYSAVYDGFPVDKAIHYLMNFPYTVDVDFL